MDADRVVGEMDGANQLGANIEDHNLHNCDLQNKIGFFVGLLKSFSCNYSYFQEKFERNRLKIIKIAAPTAVQSIQYIKNNR